MSYTFIRTVHRKKGDQLHLTCDRCGSGLTNMAIEATKDGKIVYLGADCAGRVEVTAPTRAQFRAMDAKTQQALAKAEKATWGPIAKELRDESERANYARGVQAYEITGYHSPHGYVKEFRRRLDLFLSTGSDLLPSEIEAARLKLVSNAQNALQSLSNMEYIEFRRAETDPRERTRLSNQHLAWRAERYMEFMAMDVEQLHATLQKLRNSLIETLSKHLPRNAKLDTTLSVEQLTRQLDLLVMTL